MSKAKRLLAAFLTVVMMMGMIPTQMFAEQAEPLAENPVTQETENAPADAEIPTPLANTQNVTYVKANKLEAGQQYLIVYTTGTSPDEVHHVLSYDGSGFQHKITGTIEGDKLTLVNGTEPNVLWKAAKKSDGAFYFQRNVDTKDKNLGFYRSGSLQLVGKNSHNNTFYVKEGNDVTNPTALWHDGNTAYYLQYSENKFHVITPKDPSQLNHVTFYKRVETTNVTMTAKWFVDGAQVGANESYTVKSGETVTFKNKPDMPTTAKLVKVVVDGKEAALNENFTYTAGNKDTVVEYHYMSDPVTLTVQYFYEDDMSKPAATTTVTVPNQKEYAITPDNKFAGKELVKTVVNDTELAAPSLTVTPDGNTFVKLIYKAQPATLKVEWYVTEKSSSGSKTNLYKTDVSEVKVGDTANLNIPVSMQGLTFDKAEVNNSGKLDKTGKTAPTQVTIHNKGETVVKVYYIYNRGNADQILHPDDASSGLEIPEYPDQGSVRINKKATADNFWGNGIANVELAATGIPIKRGVDVVILFDVSTSMGSPVKKGGETKLDAAKREAVAFVNQLLADNEDGTQSSNRVGLVTFAGWKSSKNNPQGNEIKFRLRNANGKNEITKYINGLQNPNGEDDPGSLFAGTDYDYAFEGAQEVLNDALPSREKYVVFMTDGAPHKYNKVVWESDAADSELVTQATGNLHNGAELVKKGDASFTNTAEVYSIGFGMNWSDKDLNNGFTVKQANAILKKMATSDPADTPAENQHYVDAKDPTALQNAFDNIATAILKAGTDTFVSDQMGDAYDLQMANKVPVKGDILKPAPAIEVKSYKLYTKADVTAGNCTQEQVGTRKPGEPTLIERVTFSDDGTKAYSNLIDGGTTDIKDKDGNIIAQNFAYYVKETKLSNGTTAPAESFIWQIGDITTEEIALSYPVYLTGSMEGKRADGVYDTNNFARIDYTNYKGHKHTEQTFVKPNMPWGSAVVNYEFYLVNKEGQPVNTRNEVIPFEHRVKIGDPQQKSFKLNSGTEIDAQLNAKDVVPRGYELHMPDAVYNVTAVSTGKGTQTATGKAGTGYSGNSTHIWKNDPQCINTGVAFGVVNTLTLIPDVVVLDYGKPIAIDVLSNDRVMDNTLFGLCATDSNGTVALGRELAASASASASFTGKYGTAKVEGDHVLYTLDKFMNGVDKFLYVTKETTTGTDGNTTVAGYRYQEVTAMPATTVYYEDNFNSNNEDNKDASVGIVYSGGWTTEGTYKGGNQDDGSKHDHPYGQDSSYTNDNQLSAGSAHVVNGAFENPPTATFTFNGTGFDLIARTDLKSAAVMVKVYAGAEKAGTPIYSKLVDCQFKDQNVNNGVLNQIPVIAWHAKDEAYGTYTVEIAVRVRKSEADLNKNFYLDAIRVYNPVDPTGSDNTVVQDQYAQDNEANAQIFELRKLLLDQNSFTAGTTANGVVYVDSFKRASGEVTPSLGTYEQIGPNNEIYLKPGNSVGIKIVVDKAPTAVHLGAKAPFGSAVCTYGTLADRKITLNTATDMYYDLGTILDFKEQTPGGKLAATLIITNTGDNILSLTTLKLTFDDAAAQVAFVADDALTQDTATFTAMRMAPAPTPDPDIPVEPDPTPDPEPQPEPQPGKPSIWDQLEDFFNGLFGPRH